MDLKAGYGCCTVTESAARGAVYEGHGPQAVYEERSDATYLAYRGPDANPFATRYDHETRSFEEPTRIGENPLPISDNHGPPSLCLDDRGFVYVFYGSHGSPHCVARSHKPFDVGTWTDIGPMDDVPAGTYPSPVVLEGTIYVTYRSGPGWYSRTYPSAQYATIACSSDGGRTFEDLGPILDVTDHPDEVSIAYVSDVGEQDGRLHLTWFICHDHAMPVTAASQHRSGVYHAVYDPDKRVIGPVDGPEREPPLTWSEMNGTAVEVFAGTDVNHPKHVLSPAGPEILFGHYDPATVHFEDGTTRIEWLVAAWDDGRWRIERIPNAFATHLFDGGYPRYNDAGELEAHVITGGDDKDLVDGARGGDFEVVTRTPEGWSHQSVTTATSNGSPLSRVTTVENGLDEFASLFIPASEDPAAFDLPLFACGSAW